MNGLQDQINVAAGIPIPPGNQPATSIVPEIEREIKTPVLERLKAFNSQFAPSAPSQAAENQPEMTDQEKRIQEAQSTLDALKPLLFDRLKESIKLEGEAVAETKRIAPTEEKILAKLTKAIKDNQAARSDLVKQVFSALQPTPQAPEIKSTQEYLKNIGPIVAGIMATVSMIKGGSTFSPAGVQFADMYNGMVGAWRSRDAEQFEKETINFKDHLLAAKSQNDKIMSEYQLALESIIRGEETEAKIAELQIKQLHQPQEVILKQAEMISSVVSQLTGIINLFDQADLKKLIFAEREQRNELIDKLKLATFELALAKFQQTGFSDKQLDLIADGILKTPLMTKEQAQIVKEGRKKDKAEVAGAEEEAREKARRGSEVDISTATESQIRIATQLANYELAPPAGFALKSPYWQEILSLAKQIDPSYDASQFQVRQRLKQDFASGNAAKNIRSLNTAVGHLDSMMKSGAALKNSSFQVWNWIKNKGLEATGDPRPEKFMTDVNAVSGELATVFKNTSGTDQEIKSWKERTGLIKSPEQIKTQVEEVIDLLGSRLYAFQNQYETGMGKPKDYHFLSEKSRQILGRVIGMDKVDQWDRAVKTNVPTKETYNIGDIYRGKKIIGINRETRQINVEGIGVVSY